jgi:hypothetical protein
VSAPRVERPVTPIVEETVRVSVERPPVTVRPSVKSIVPSTVTFPSTVKFVVTVKEPGTVIEVGKEKVISPEPAVVVICPEVPANWIFPAEGVTTVAL